MLNEKLDKILSLLAPTSKKEEIKVAEPKAKVVKVKKDIKKIPVKKVVAPKKAKVKVKKKK
jgi:hypothetical protein